MAKTDPTPKPITTFTHADDTRKNIPTAEYQAMVESDTKTPIQVAYQRRNRDLDPQLIWRGKDEQDWSDLVVNAPPLYIQEKVHPKVLIDDLVKQSQKGQKVEQFDLFADFNGLPSEGAKTEFYQHDAHWTNRMILGDSLQVMASLAEREGLRGKVQCIYFDPPYGIKFNSNFQWSTTSRDVKDGSLEHITREPEQVKAFRDTWRDGIHSYLTYLRDRLTVARDLLIDSGSIFVQIGDENVHRVRALMDEVFGEDNFISLIQFRKTAYQATDYLANTCDFIVWYSRVKAKCKVRQLQYVRPAEMVESGFTWALLENGIITPAAKIQNEEKYERFQSSNLTSQGASEIGSNPFLWHGKQFTIGNNKHWKTSSAGLEVLSKADRLFSVGNTLTFKRFANDFPVAPYSNMWTDTIQSTFAIQNIYVVQTATKVIERCLLMASDPGDLVLDPTCGSGTTAYVAEQWGRRWITIDTSRVALALARARIMGARYPYYLMADSPEGQQKESEVTLTPLSSQKTYRNLKHGFVYERVPHITLKSIANNAEIDVIWDKWQAVLEPLRAQLNQDLGKTWEEWEIPREADSKWSDAAKKAQADWWQARIARQKEIDASIDAKAEFEYLYDKPYEDKKKVRVAGPFTVESLSPHRTFAVDEHDELVDSVREPSPAYDVHDFAGLILDNLLKAGVQQPDKANKIVFSSLTPWPGRFICAEGRYGDNRAAIFLGPEFGTVSRPDLVEAAREAAEAGFDVLISCAFNYDAHSTEFHKLGRIPVLKARMNADLHMAEDLRNNGQGNLFVIFGEPDIKPWEGGSELIAAELNKIEVDIPLIDEKITIGREKIKELKHELSEKKTLSKSDKSHEPEVHRLEHDISLLSQDIELQLNLKARHIAFRDKAPLIPESMLVVEILGVDVFDPRSGRVRSDGPDGIACWFIDTDYNEESFFVRHAYFLGANDPYGSLKTTLKAEVNADAWATLNSAVSRPFDKPKNGRIAVKVINHLGDEVMKVFRV